MKQFIVKNSKAITSFVSLLLIGIITLSFQDSPVVRPQFDIRLPDYDTLPEKNSQNSLKLKDFDNLQQELDKSLQQVSAEIRRIDLNQIQSTIEKALKEVDFKKILNETASSITAIDLEKILAEVNTSVKGIDLNSISDEIKMALNNAKEEIAKAGKELKRTDFSSIEKAMRESTVELKKAQQELKNLDFNKIADEAKAGITKAKSELTEIRTMFNEMEKDGLIDQKAGFSIEFKDRMLYINGQKQSEKITEKYRPQFKNDHFKIMIEKE